MKTGAHILIVDDELPIVRVLTSTLKAAGYSVTAAGSGSDALKAIAKSAPDVVILDLGLPDMDGKDVITSIREWTDAPVLVISARQEETERVAALDIGADDYVCKPFHMGELQARLRAALRHVARRNTIQSEYCAGDLKIDFSTRRVMLAGIEMKLTPKEHDLLRALAQHAGQVVTHKQLLAAGWGTSFADTQFVRVYIGQLRQKLEADPGAPQIILTEPGVGYRLRED